MSLPPLPFTAAPVARLERPSLDELTARLHGEPVILTGLLEDSPLFRQLRERPSLEEKLRLLRQEYFRDTRIEFDALPRESRGHYGASYGPDVSGFTEVPFEAFEDRLLRAESSGEFVYLRSHPIAPDSLIEQGLRLGFLRFAPAQNVLRKIWLGSNGQVVNLHYDDFINFICMFNGTKRVTMFGPDQLADMYHAPFDLMSGGAQSSYVRLLDPDLQRFPRFRQALPNAKVAVIEPGDVLLIPPLWWHHVESFSFNVMVNNWVLSVPLKTLVAMWRDLSNAIRLLAHGSGEARARAREVFARHVFAPGPTDASPVPAELREQVQRAAELVRALPAFWREHHARMYDEFVFQRNGTPFPSEPGAFAALLERNAASASLFPNGAMLDAMPDA